MIEIESGGPQNIGCTKWDIKNFRQNLKQKVDDIYAESLI